MKLSILISLLIYSYPVFSQSIVDNLTGSDQRNYVRISNQSRKVPSAISTNPGLLASYLISSAKTDLEKIRAFYVWITSNINYDLSSFRKGLYPPQDPPIVLARRTAVCQGYAELFKELCNEVQIPATVITGYSKGYGYTPGKEFVMGDHAWNAVKIDHNWYLIDATWGSGPGSHPMNGTTISLFDKYFLSPPEIFVQDHLPLDPIWQLMDNPVPLGVYELGESAIASYLQSGHEDFNFKDSLKRWEESDQYQALIESHKRSISFNPKNKRAVYHLGVELLFSGLEIMETIHQVPYQGFEKTVEEMRKSMFAKLDEAAFHFSHVPPEHPDYESASIFLEEVTFEKGVFFYEVGQRIYDLFLEMDKESFLKNLQTGVHQIDIYYGLATYYFNLVNKESKYYEDAREYITDYIKNKNPLIPKR